MGLRLLLLITSLVVGVTAAVGQEKKSDFEQQLSSLNNPNHLKLEIAPRELELNENPDKLKEPYKTGADIYFRILISNTSVEPMVIFISNPYFQNRPVLLKDGQEVPYRRKISELVAATDGEATSFRHYSMRLEPSATASLGILRMSSWYDPLEPGSYDLIDRYRFVPRGQWIESPVFRFEVQPK